MLKLQFVTCWRHCIVIFLEVILISGHMVSVHHYTSMICRAGQAAGNIVDFQNNKAIEELSGERNEKNESRRLAAVCFVVLYTLIIVSKLLTICRYLRLLYTTGAYTPRAGLMHTHPLLPEHIQVL